MRTEEKAATRKATPLPGAVWALGLTSLFMAALNELVWRNVSTNTWVSFKAFGFLPLTFLFAIAQMPLMQRYSEVANRKDAQVTPPGEGSS